MNNFMMTQQGYLQNLQNIINDAQNRINQIQNQTQTQQQTPITQNFQLAPSNEKGIKYAENDEDVSNHLVLVDTLFVNKELTKMWYKNASGEIKTYSLKEIIVLDEKDQEIAKLRQKIEEMEAKYESSTTVNNEPIGKSKPTKIKSSKTDDE